MSQPSHSENCSEELSGTVSGELPGKLSENAFTENSNPEPTGVAPTPKAEDASEVSPSGSYVKYAMRNMVRKRGTSLQHFFLTTTALLAVLVGLSYLTR